MNFIRLFVITAAATSAWLLDSVSASNVPCAPQKEGENDGSSFCESILRPGSRCIDGFCSNPFYHGGCLKSLLPDWNRTRICNSQDPPDAEEKGYCYSSPFDYTEIRIHAKNYESPNLIAWILQILLSEVLEIPTAIETGSPDTHLNLYHPKSPFDFSKVILDPTYDFLQLDQESGNVKGAHIDPEAWLSDMDPKVVANMNTRMEPRELGIMGENAVFIPKFVALQDPSLVSYMGLQGEENRKKLAKTFKRPTRFGQYCQEFSPSRCTQSDPIARRGPPQDEDEANSFFIPGGIFNGFFRDTHANDCDANPYNCTGHFVDYPCGWGSYAQPRAHHLNMAFSFEGPQPNGGYDDTAATQIWLAANATKSPVIMMWWTPEVLYEQFLGTDAEFTRVLFPPPTLECQENRIDFLDLCDPDLSLEEKMGNPQGTCDTYPQNILKLLSLALPEITKGSHIDPEFYSPAYDILTDFQINNLELDQIFKYWAERETDHLNFDPRDAACRWAVENLDLLQAFIPETHPRAILDVDTANVNLFNGALVLAVVALLIAIASTVLVFIKRKSKAIYHTQTEFLYLFLSGLILLSIAAILYTQNPSDFVCVMPAWLYNLGYAIHYAPLVYKITEIQKLVSSGKQMQRVRLKTFQLFRFTTMIVLPVVAYVAVWTAVDPPGEMVNFQLTDMMTEEGRTIVGYQDACGSEMGYIWVYFGLGWRILLLLMGCLYSLVAIQVREDMNDTKSVALVLFLHLFFLIFQALWYPSVRARSQVDVVANASILFSCETILSVAIYVLPKFLQSGENMQDEILPDVFVHTTIALVEVTGFTEWTSVREPIAVFQFLEQLYEHFDSLAEKHQVFKVETVGECYVAATGVPSPQSDHVVRMARFVSDCTRKMPRFLNKMEVRFGPDTASLSLRASMHSGPVTGGFLRGKGSRFQLFGDTMTSASLFLTHSGEGKIHVSEETANLLKAAGRKRWVTARDDKVYTIEKGELQTYWLVKDNKSEHGTEEGTSGHLSSEAAQSDSEDDDTGLSSQERWVDYNTEIFKGLLQQILARRASTSSLSRTTSMDSRSSAGSNDQVAATMPLEEVKEVIELPKFDKRAARRQRENQDVEVPKAVVAQLRKYISEIADLYNDNPFHNFAHCSYVVMAQCKYMSRIRAASEIDLGDNEDRMRSSVQAALHDHTYGITSDPLTLFACCYSALIHDVDHPGVPNGQLIKEDEAIATKYQNRSVAEQKSLDIAMDLLNEPRFNVLRSAICKNSAEMARFRQLVVNMVMATDLGDTQLKELRNGRWTKAFAQDASSVDPSVSASISASSERASSALSSEREGDLPIVGNQRESINRKATIVLEHLIQAADVAHMSQHWLIYRKWNARLFREMYLAYREGRSATNPADGWYKGEIGFFDFYIIPLSKKLRDCGVFGPTSDENLNYATHNRNMWVKEGEAITKEMLKEAEEEYEKGLLRSSVVKRKKVEEIEQARK